MLDQPRLLQARDPALWLALETPSSSPQPCVFGHRVALVGEVPWVWEPELPELLAHNSLQCVVEDYILNGVMCYINDYVL
jgi:hypothetical protein